jgi:membrane fusion protein, multidrug efflux system
MKQILRIATALAVMIIVAACGNGRKEDKAALGDKKAELAKLKGEQSKLAEQIKKLEEEIVKADPAAAAARVQKLVSVQPLLVQDFNHYIDLQGKIDADNISFVSPRGMPGQVKALYVKNGDVVRKGQLLAKLDDAVVKQNITAAKQGLEQIKTQLAFAKNIYQRQKNLWDQNIGTEVQVITAKATVETLENQLKTAEENVKSAQEQWATTNVYADVSGIADKVNVKVGETFTGFAGQQPQIQIVNTSSLKLTASIPENYLSKVHKGSQLQIVIPDLNNKTINATVTVISQLIDPVLRGFIVEAKIPYDASLKPNQVAIAKILDYSAPKAVLVPINVVQTDEKGKYVYVMEKQGEKTIARKKPVIAGETYNGLFEIKSGLAGGDLIITDGYQSVYDGQAITTGK